MNRHRLSRASRGVATLEFVILLPIYLMLVFGMLEVYQYFRTVGVIDRTVTPGSRGVLGMEVESALRGTRG